MKEETVTRYLKNDFEANKKLYEAASFLKTGFEGIDSVVKFTRGAR